MSSKPSAATRASSRTKTAASNVPTTTRTTRARAVKATTTPAEVPAPPVKKATRKPLVSKDNSIDAPTPPAKGKAKCTPTRKAEKQANVESEREPIMAYLRIRPRVGEEDPNSIPYLTPLSDTMVNMTDPQDPQNARSKYRISTVPPSSIYTFSHVFPPNTTQLDFFTKTTLPLVQDVLTGQNGLLFTYGVTNSGKTYTVQGGKEEGAAGILPRSLDVIFNSIGGLHGDGRYRPVRLYGVELADDTDSVAPPTMPEPAIVEVLGSLDNMAELEFDVDPTIVKVDRNYEYTIWISYAEVYNEKVYDLLASVKGDSGSRVGGTTRQAAGKPLLLTRQALPLRPSPPSDTNDTESSGKYIAGLRQLRVHSAAQAKELVKLGQLHRRVFGTLANRESSRSHSMVIIKVVRGHRGERDISRLTLVDLAGSERTKHTHTTGDRLKEAGNINKSLMVLGQCMEVMRSNQRKLAVSLSLDDKDGRMDTRDVKKGLSVVPFRHSKLTEALMDYFVADGRTVMIVNVNPYDTGYDENSHVMKFAALAREVYTTPAQAPVQRVPAAVGPGKLHGNKIKNLGPLSLSDPEIIPYPYSRKVTISVGNKGGKKPVEAILEVREEDEPQDEKDSGEDDSYPINPLVDALFDEVESLRMQLFESEMRCAVIEAETREEVMREMEERMRSVEAMYSRRMMAEFEQNELKTDAKIDMLHQSGLFGSPAKTTRRPLYQEDMSEEEEDIEMSLVQYGDDDSDISMEEGHSRGNSLSPLAKKSKPPSTSKSPRKSSVAPQPIIEKRQFIPDPPMLPSDTEDAEMTETECAEDEETNSIAPSGATASEPADDDDEEEEEEEESTDQDDEDYSEPDDEDDEEWEEPAYSKTPKGKKQIIISPSPSPSPKVTKAAVPSAVKGPARNVRISKLAQEMDRLGLQDAYNADDSVVILPKKAYRKSRPSTVAASTVATSSIITADNEVDEDNSDPFELPVVKKKKRQLGKKPIMNEEDINKATYAAEKKIAKIQSSGTIRRLHK
ncbi:hypothetical protein NLJ89_g3159 [Agrocybe chaxingu]|uniref:Kinesin motor domain-containing protein n=1 Tax=Agrocybe chaxingu TaxID=84603 RepID=A0A9W8K559_9AGAR|nr:hypothetical protein NLJ89_g3159 [Agrocybe chaxingu]